MARAYTGCRILHQKFLNLELPSLSFDGIFANASLFHVPSQELPRVLSDLHTALRPGGILFLSNLRGEAKDGRDKDMVITWKSILAVSICRRRDLQYSIFITGLQVNLGMNSLG